MCCGVVLLLFLLLSKERFASQAQLGFLVGAAGPGPMVKKADEVAGKLLVSLLVDLLVCS
jgi:hypothetical protein